MCDDGEPVHRLDPGATPEGQPQAAPDGLLDQGPSVGRPQRDDGVEVGYVPPLLEHVDVDDDLGGLVGVFDRQQPLDRLLLLVALECGVDFDDPLGVPPLEEGLRLEQLQQLRGVFGVLGDHEHERLDVGLAGLGCVDPKVRLHLLVQAHAVLQLNTLQPRLVELLGVEVLACRDRRLLHETVHDGLCQRVRVDGVGEGNGSLLALALGEGRRRQLQPEDGLQLVDRRHPRVGPIAVRFVHEHDEVGQARQVVEVGLADVLGQALDTRRALLSRGGLHVLVDLGDVEDVDVDRVFATHPKQPHLDAVLGSDADPTLVGVARDDDRRSRDELRDPLKHVLGGTRREVRDQLVVDGEVRCQHEEMAAALGDVQVGDERAHQPGLADPGGEREAQGRELPLEVRHARILGLDDRQGRGEVVVLAGVGDLADPFEDLQRLTLRRAEAQAARDRVDDAAHASPPLVAAAKSGSRSWTFGALPRPLLGLPSTGAGSSGSGSGSCPITVATFNE